MKSIDSNEIVAKPTAIQSEPPVHTVEGHESCAYYPNVGLDTMSCPHDEFASGAFYSEDMINDIRRTSHRLIARLDEMVVKKRFSWMIMPDYTDFVAELNQLRELTR
jgi:hypothetical protein